MLICYDPDEYETVTEYKRCAYCEMHPGEFWAGCTCSFSTTQRRRPPEEFHAIKAKKRREYEDRVLAEAELIKASRGVSAPTRHPIQEP